MKRIILILFAIGITAMSSVSMAAMSNSRVRKETRFLTDKMAYELNLNTAQYNDVYEINFDFIYSIRYLMDDVIRGYEWALDDYYNYLDVRNDDLRWVLSDAQYRRFLQADYFYRPIYASGGGWNFRVYITYTNRNYFYFPKPYHYRSYSGGHYRTHFHNVSYYRGRYNHNYYRGDYSVRNDRVYHTNRRSDFGSVNIRPNTSTRPSSRPGTQPLVPVCLLARVPVQPVRARARVPVRVLQPVRVQVRLLPARVIPLRHHRAGRTRQVAEGKITVRAAVHR